MMRALLDIVFRRFRTCAFLSGWDTAVAGDMLVLLQLCQDSRPERISEKVVDQLAEAILRLLGVPADGAARLAALPIADASTR